MANIRSTAIAIDGDTATLIVRNHDRWFWETEHDRPCDTCEKDRKTLDSDEPSDVYCPECDSTRRLTFTLDVECDEPDIDRCEDQGVHNGPTCEERRCFKGRFAVSVHVAEVLPIIEWDTVDLGLPHPVPCMTIDPHGNALEADEAGVDWFKAHDRTLPPDAAPGMFAVRLAVHT
jgi:hypothetical protein